MQRRDEDDSLDSRPVKLAQLRVQLETAQRRIAVLTEERDGLRAHCEELIDEVLELRTRLRLKLNGRAA